MDKGETGEVCLKMPTILDMDIQDNTKVEDNAITNITPAGIKMINKGLQISSKNYQNEENLWMHTSE